MGLVGLPGMKKAPGAFEGSQGGGDGCGGSSVHDGGGTVPDGGEAAGDGVLREAQAGGNEALLHTCGGELYNQHILRCGGGTVEDVGGDGCGLWVGGASADHAELHPCPFLRAAFAAAVGIVLPVNGQTRGPGCTHKDGGGGILQAGGGADALQVMGKPGPCLADDVFHGFRPGLPGSHPSGCGGRRENALPVGGFGGPGLSVTGEAVCADAERLDHVGSLGALAVLQGGADIVKGQPVPGGFSPVLPCGLAQSFIPGLPAAVLRVAGDVFLIHGGGGGGDAGQPCGAGTAAAGGGHVLRVLQDGGDGQPDGGAGNIVAAEIPAEALPQIGAPELAFDPGSFGGGGGGVGGGHGGVLLSISGGFGRSYDGNTLSYNTVIVNTDIALFSSFFPGGCIKRRGSVDHMFGSPTRRAAPGGPLSGGGGGGWPWPGGGERSPG